ncbi:MAG: tol-pal system-associated acyl-CoA thioesterase [Gammaproteobacteria bacterium]|nr:tol-pal system-associated acyl-CoA thioesterase [Gammaproteobacteria bacterium]
MREFILPMRVYYEDTDSTGVVYHANYLKFMERARTEWLRSIGIEQDEFAKEYGLIFAVRSVQLDYFKPAKFNDLLAISVSITRIGGASLGFDQAVTKTTAQANGQQNIQKNILCVGKVKVACLAADSLRPKPIPGKINREIF